LPSQIAYVAFSPDSGKLLAVRHSKGAFVWDARTGKQLAGRDIDRAPAELDEGERSIRPAAFSADGKSVASMVYESVVVWDASSGRPICPSLVPPAPLLGRGVSDWPSVVALAPGGKAVAAAGKYAWVWTVAGERIDRVADTQPVRSPRDLVFSPDGKRVLIAARFNDAGVYDAQSGDQVFTIGRDTDEIPIVAYSPDGKYVAAAFPKDDSTTIRVKPAGRWR
jgi:WD40 repeat protein